MRALVLVMLCGCSGWDPAWMKVTGEDEHVIVMKKSVTARQAPPNVTVLVDRVDREVRDGLIEQIARGSPYVRFGLAFTGSSCGEGLVIPPGAAPELLIGVLQSRPPEGVSSWAASLAQVPSSTDDNTDYVMLVTSSSDDACGGDAVEAVRALRTRDVLTIVVSVGPSSPTLDEMGRQGGVPASCGMGTDAECQTVRCDAMTGHCVDPTYQVHDAAALPALFDSLFWGFGPGATVCRYTLSATPSRPDRVRVTVEGEVLRNPEDYTLADQSITFSDERCRYLLANGTPWSPVHLEIRIDTRP